MKTLMAFGDSNTHGSVPLEELSDQRRFSRDVRWPGVLAAALAPEWHVIEEGHPGRTTVWPDPIEGVHKAGLAVLPALLETHRPLNLVVVMLGTNDLKVRFGLPACDIAFGVRNIVEAILASTAGLDQTAPACLLVAPPPIKEVGRLAEVFAGAAPKSAELGMRYCAIAEETGVAFLDAGQVAEMSDFEGIHMEAAGHLAVGKAVADAVSKMAFSK